MKIRNGVIDVTYLNDIVKDKRNFHIEINILNAAFKAANIRISNDPVIDTRIPIYIHHCELWFYTLCGTFDVKKASFNTTCCSFHFGTLGNLPIKRAKDAVCFLQRDGVSVASSAIKYNIVKVKVTHWPINPSFHTELKCI